MASLVTVADFRAYAGAGAATVPDSLIEQVLDEAEAGLVQDVLAPLFAITMSPAATVLATGEELRRASRLLARRNSPEAIGGVGDMLMSIPSRDPDSARTIAAIRSVLVVSEGIA